MAEKQQNQLVFYSWSDKLRAVFSKYNEGESYQLRKAIEDFNLKLNQYMGQSLVKNYMHLIFSTKHREQLISESLSDALYNYMGGVCNGIDCKPLKIGGGGDHVHILCMLSKKIALIKLLEEVKSHSSKWAKVTVPGLKNFYWQDGYGAFSVNPSETEKVINYISNQRIHHQKITFRMSIGHF